MGRLLTLGDDDDEAGFFARQFGLSSLRITAYTGDGTMKRAGGEAELGAYVSAALVPGLNVRSPNGRPPPCPAEEDGFGSDSAAAALLEVERERARWAAMNSAE
jgi:hypothetical protein